MIGDIFVAIGMLWFLLAEVRQFRKVIKLYGKNHIITSISLTHYNWKILAILSAIIGYTLKDLPLSRIVIIIELVLTAIMIKLIAELRQLSFKDYVKEWI